MRLRGREESAARNADAFDDMGYHGEALLWRARSQAYGIAAEDAEALLQPADRQPAGARDQRDTAPRCEERTCIRGSGHWGPHVVNLASSEPKPVKQKEASNG
jgi:hypothetical protein